MVKNLNYTIKIEIELQINNEQQKNTPHVECIVNFINYFRAIAYDYCKQPLVFLRSPDFIYFQFWNSVFLNLIGGELHFLFFIFTDFYFRHVLSEESEWVISKFM